MSEITRVLGAIQQGDRFASKQLLPLVYEELRRLAAHRMTSEQPGQTLQATALVHEAYLRLVDTNCPQQWDGSGHFFAAAAEAMRRILVENARRKARIKHGGDRHRASLVDAPAITDDEQLLALDDALTRLADEDSEAAQVAELHHFAGLSHEQVAQTLDLTVYQVRQKWSYARAWLRDALDG